MRWPRPPASRHTPGFWCCFPLFGAGLLLLGGKATNAWGHLLATALSWASFVLGFLLLISMVGRGHEERAAHVGGWNWIPAGQFQLETGLLIDQLSIAFVLLITFVGSLIHVYSIGYMEHDENRRKFFAYLNLFVASMLLLVLADSYLLLFVGWEGVGLASYLLIGFWNHNPAYATAANKAFFVNRVGDVGMSIAIMFMFYTFGAVDFATVHAGAAEAGSTAMTALGLLLLIGACAKSAQFPLQSWLGDAMAGPTPVSALIHAATMVTAGVYLVVRSHDIFNAAPNAQLAVADRRCDHAALRCDRRLRQGRHQEGAGRLDDVPDRLHDARRGSRPGRLRLRDLPPHHPRLLQGRHVPRRRIGHARHERQRRHAPLRWALELP